MQKKGSGRKTFMQESMEMWPESTIFDGHYIIIIEWLDKLTWSRGSTGIQACRKSCHRLDPIISLPCRRCNIKSSACLHTFAKQNQTKKTPNVKLHVHYYHSPWLKLPGWHLQFICCLFHQIQELHNKRQFKKQFVYQNEKG